MQDHSFSAFMGLLFVGSLFLLSRYFDYRDGEDKKERDRQDELTRETADRASRAQCRREIRAEQEQECREQFARRVEWAQREAREEAAKRIEQRRVAVMVNDPTEHFHRWLRGDIDEGSQKHIASRERAVDAEYQRILKERLATLQIEEREQLRLIAEEARQRDVAALLRNSSTDPIPYFYHWVRGDPNESFRCDVDGNSHRAVLEECVRRCHEWTREIQERANSQVKGMMMFRRQRGEDEMLLRGASPAVLQALLGLTCDILGPGRAVVYPGLMYCNFPARRVCFIAGDENPLTPAMFEPYHEKLQRLWGGPVVIESGGYIGGVIVRPKIAGDG